MQNKKLMTIPLILVSALVIAGFAYAHWSETLYINGTVIPGELDWEFINWNCLDNGKDYHARDGFAGPAPISWIGDKDIGSQELTPWDSDGDGDYDTMNFTLYHVYPSYFTSVSVYAKNTGTIPLIIDSVIINDVIVLRKEPTSYYQLDLTGDGKADVDFWWGNGFGVQLHPGDNSPEMSFWIHIRQDAPEGAQFGFKIAIVAVNWNQYVPPT